MILVERHIIKENHKFYKECDELSSKSKNLYNQGLCNIKQHYTEFKTYLDYVKNFHKTKVSEIYKSLPAKVANQTLKSLDQNFKSFYKLYKNKEVFANIPKYLDKEKGRFTVRYEKQAISVKVFKKVGELKLSLTNIYIKTKVKEWNDIKEVRIVPKTRHYVIEVVYNKKEESNNNSVIAAIDAGLNNLATITYNNGSQPIIINGKPLKSINQYYNKKKAKMRSLLELKNNQKTSKNIQKLNFKRNNKINDYIHKASKLVVDNLIFQKVGVLVIGKNTSQKTNINLGTKTNQNFSQTPIVKFLDMVCYKSKLKGIDVIWQEESYTSKASFLDLDYIPTYKESKSYEFSGYRKHRGVYKIKNSNLEINADVNASYNILRKAVPNSFDDGIEGFAINPIKLNV